MSLTSLAYLNADFSSITVSGHSAGCQWSQTMMMMFSDTIKGGVFVHCGPYSTDLPDFGGPTVTTDSLRAKANAAVNVERPKIDPTSNLATRAAWVCKGTQDTTVRPLVVDATYWFLRD